MPAVSQKKRGIDMAFVYETSFRLPDEVAKIQYNLAADLETLLKNVNAALTKLSGPPCMTSEGPLYTKPPKGLSAHRDNLRSNYASFWEDTIISYDSESNGASARKIQSHNISIKPDDLEITLGYFFSKPQPILTLEKVLLHEFLHLVVKVPRVMHHGKIDSIIERRLPGDPNPLGTVGYDCGGF
jgi:hypothetical protein